MTSPASTTTDFLPDALRAAALRAPRKRPAPKGEGGTPRNCGNNFIAKPVGAPRGNRNSWKHGGYSAAMYAKMEAVRRICRKQQDISAAIGAMLGAGRNPDDHIALLEALAPTAADWRAAGLAVSDEPRTPFSLRHHPA